VVDELGDLLGVLRSPDDVGDPTAPTPNLAAIEDLISSFAASGLYVRRETSGIRRDFSDSAQLAAYRVVQEALTNAHKYGDGQADVAVRFDDRGVEIAVSNSIDHSVPQGNGFGLVGMRERVEATGGMLTAAPSADGSRFDLIALLPGRTTA
jgi:signal transduction histidine kinase